MGMYKKIGTILLILAGVSFGTVLVFLLLENLYDISLIYKNFYIILLFITIVTFVLGILIRTWYSKRLVRKVVWLATTLLFMAGVYFFHIYRVFNPKIFEHPYDKIEFSIEKDTKVVELTESWTWIMENYGGVEYKKAYVRFGIFYDNDLIEHTGEPQP